MNVTEVVQSVGVGSIVVLLGTALLGAVGWVCRRFIDHSFEKRMTEFQKKLEYETTAFRQGLELQTKLHQHELEQASTVHRVQFEALHAKRAELISELDADCYSAVWKLLDFVGMLQDGDEERQTQKGREAVQLAHAFKRRALTTRLYFSKEDGKAIVDFAIELLVLTNRCWFEYELSRKQGKNPYFADLGISDAQFGKAENRLMDEFIPKADKVQDLLRELLGVATNARSAATTPHVAPNHS